MKEEFIKPMLDPVDVSDWTCIRTDVYSFIDAFSWVIDYKGKGTFAYDYVSEAEGETFEVYDYWYFSEEVDAVVFRLHFT